MEYDILYNLGIVLLAGFITASITKRLGQSVIVGYMVAGLIIGPNALKLISDTHVLNMLSELGIVFLMFFLGLEFSINKFNKIKSSVFFIGTYEVLLNLLLGYLTGLALSFSTKDSLFLAGIMAFSSSTIVAKLLFDLRRTASYESEVLMGVMVFEDFFAILFLGILSGYAFSNNLDITVILKSFLTAVSFYAIFILIGIFIINKIIDHIIKIESQELFTCLILSIILLTSSLAVKLSLAAASGAFLLGMIINSFDIEDRLHRTISVFKDIFITVFFITFGMLLNPAQIPEILWLVAIIVPISILGEIFITSSSALISGFSPEKAVKFGTSMIARGEYSLIIASLGFASGSINPKLYQLAGVYVFIMTILAPIAMRNSNKVKSAVSKIAPEFIKFSAKLVSLTLKPLLLPEEQDKQSQKDLFFISYFSFFVFIVLTMWIIKEPVISLILSIPGIIIIVLLRKRFEIAIAKAIESSDYKSLGNTNINAGSVSNYLSNLLSTFFTLLLFSSLISIIGYTALCAAFLIFIAQIIVVSLIIFRKTK